MEKVIVIATNNMGKAKEFAAIFGARGYEVKTLRDFPEAIEVAETGTTFAENAYLKAETLADQLGCVVLADDSGLMVDALHGSPGVYSARYAGPQKSDAANNAKLLAELAEVPDAGRQAAFHCALVLAAPHRQKPSLLVEGQLQGEIARVPRGENGFGYDPLFYLPQYDKTTAELSADEKNQISHRRQAINRLLEVWEAWMAS